MSYNHSLLFFTCLILSGCASIISERILDVKSTSMNFINYDLVEEGYQKSKYCSSLNHDCISYLVADPVVNKDKKTIEIELNNGANEELIQLNLKPENTGLFSGEVLLIHGFTSSKESMISPANYFRDLGFRVLIPDLLGHGDSQSPKGFGVNDSLIIDELLNNRRKIGTPLLIVGYSMGAVTATLLAEKRKDVSGLILRAPMTQFDDAVVNFDKRYPNFLSPIIPVQSIREGAMRALDKVDISLHQTDIRPTISLLKMPTLIFSSTRDSISPSNYFHQTESNYITIVNLTNRSHIGMAVIGDEDNEQIQRWLNSKVNKTVRTTNNQVPFHSPNASH
jgi:uncharacterized protein